MKFYVIIFFVLMLGAAEAQITSQTIIQPGNTSTYHYGISANTLTIGDGSLFGVVPPGNTYDPDFTTLVLPRISAGTPDSTKSYFSQFMKMFRDSSGITTFAYGNGLDCFYWFGGWDSVSSKINWCGDTNNVTLSASVKFTQYQGFLTAIATGYINTNFNPATEGISYTQNSASYGFYSRTNAITSMIDMGMLTSLYVAVSSDAIAVSYFRINSVTYITVAAVNSLGLFSANRSGANNIEGYHNGVPVQTGTPASSALVSQNFVIGTGNAAPGQRQYLCAFAGKSFTALQQRGIYNAIQWLATKLGVNV